MKSKIAFAVIAICILLGIAAAYHVQVTAAPASHDFTLTVTGRAYDPHNHQYADVSLSLMGTARARGRGRVMILYVRGGDLDVENYGTLSVTRCGVLVKSCRYIFLHIKITPPYGGHAVVWNLRGRVSGDGVSFFSRRVVLPLPGHPRLYSLWLKGTITVD